MNARFWVMLPVLGTALSCKVVVGTSSASPADDGAASRPSTGADETPNVTSPPPAPSSPTVYTLGVGFEGVGAGEDGAERFEAYPMINGAPCWSMGETQGIAADRLLNYRWQGPTLGSNNVPAWPFDVPEGTLFVLADPDPTPLDDTVFAAVVQGSELIVMRNRDDDFEKTWNASPLKDDALCKLPFPAGTTMTLKSLPSLVAAPGTPWSAPYYDGDGDGHSDPWTEYQCEVDSDDFAEDEYGRIPPSYEGRLTYAGDVRQPQLFGRTIRPEFYHRVRPFFWTLDGDLYPQSDRDGEPVTYPLKSGAVINTPSMQMVTLRRPLWVAAKSGTCGDVSVRGGDRIFRAPGACYGDDTGLELCPIKVEHSTVSESEGTATPQCLELLSPDYGVLGDVLGGESVVDRMTPDDKLRAFVSINESKRLEALTTYYDPEEAKQIVEECQCWASTLQAVPSAPPQPTSPSLESLSSEFGTAIGEYIFARLGWWVDLPKKGLLQLDQDNFLLESRCAASDSALRNAKWSRDGG